jgi:glycosyltransferase involved in cell wall biosynthesis
VSGTQIVPETCGAVGTAPLPRKVIHIVENLDRGAVEQWLVRMLRHARSSGVDVDWTFYCALGRPGALDGAAREAGARIVLSPEPWARARPFARALRAELAQNSYAVMHCHHDLMNALYLISAAGRGISRTVVHVHNADEHLPTNSGLKRWVALELMRRICLSADRVVGISNHTLDRMLAGRPRRPGRDRVHYYGVDPAPFAGSPRDKVAFRRAIGLADEARVMLFGGRIVPEKNPVFAVDVLAQLKRLESKAVLVIAGAGSLEDAVRERAVELGVCDAVKMIGWRSDLPAVMSASDLFILPRPETPMEGFGLAVVEAQLAGLRLLLSRGIPDDPLLPTAVSRRLPLSDGAKAWARAAVELLRAPRPSKAEALTALAASPMDMDRALGDLQRLHA